MLEHLVDKPWEEWSTHPVSARLKATIAETVRETLKARLPAFMLPDAVVVLDEFPRLLNGKLDRNALPLDVTERSDIGSRYIPGRDSLEVALVALWEETLGLAPIGIRDDFVQLGGNSIAALHLIGRIRRELSSDIDLASLLVGQTIETVAEQIRTRSSALLPLLVPLRRSPSGNPIFCFHASGGTVTPYAELARFLAVPSPIIGVTAPALTRKMAPPETVEQMTALYADAISRHVPQKRCSLIGWSFGGVLAYETAKQLQKMGIAVDFLGLIDTRFGLAGKAEAHLLDVACSQLAGETGAPIDMAAAGRGSSEEQLAQVLLQSGRLPKGLTHDDVSRLISVVTAHLRALSRYRVTQPPFDGSMMHFRAEAEADANMTGARAPTPAALCSGNVTSVVVPGTHFSMMARPHVANLAALLSLHLETQG